MSKRLILVLALALVVGVSFAAYAEVQNVKVSGDITVTGIARNALTLSKDPALDNASAAVADFGKKVRAILSQVRVRVDADLTDNVSTTVRLLNERTWGEEIKEPATPATYRGDSENSSIDIDLAYATMKEFLYSPLTLTIGRQELKFGNSLVVGARTTNAIAGGHLDADRLLPNSLDDFTMRKSFDAIRAILNYDPLVIDAIYSKVTESGVATFDDTNLYGVNASYAVDKNLNVEGYTFLRARDTGVVVGSKGEDLYTTGAKVNYTGIKDLSLGLESAFQYGNHLANRTLYANEGLNDTTARKVRAWAVQAMADYQIPMMTKYVPMVSGSYTYLSGDKARSQRTTDKGWDPMFEDQNSGTLFNKIFALTNMQIINLNLSVKPIEDVKIIASYYNLRANQPYVVEGALTRTLSGIPGDPIATMKPERYGLGNEVDLGITYDYTEDVQFVLSGGAFMPGGAFEKPNRETAKQVIGSMKVTF